MANSRAWSIANIHTDTSGNIGIGFVPTAGYGLLQVGQVLGYVDSGNIATFAATNTSYAQVIAQNKSNAATASTNYNASNDAGTASTNYVEFGINSSTFTGAGSFNKAGAAYLASASTDLVLGTYGNNAVRIVVNNSATDSVVITSSGMTVGGTLSASGNISANGAASTIRQTDGSGNNIHWLSSVATLVGSGSATDAAYGAYGSFNWYPANGIARAMQLSSTGLAVTGAISTTGNINYNGVNTQVVIGELDSNTTFIQSKNSGGTAKALAFFGSSEYGRFDTNGNFGLGVTPSAWVGQRSLQLASGSAITSSDTNFYVGANYYYSGGERYNTSGQLASRYAQLSGTHVWSTAPSGTAGNPITFTQAMTLDASGNLLVGQTTTGAVQSGVWIAPNAGAATQNTSHQNGTVSGSSYTGYYYNATLIGSITQSGTTAVLYNTTSDYRLKENVQPVTSALATIAQLNPVNFTWKADGRPDTGFIAHEFQAVIPNNVTGEKDAVDADGKPVYQQMDNSGAIPYLVKAIQELKAEFDAYKVTHQ